MFTSTGHQGEENIRGCGDVLLRNIREEKDVKGYLRKSIKNSGGF